MRSASLSPAPLHFALVFFLPQTASYDWTVKVWSLCSSTPALVVTLQPGMDYVTDACWSSAHPSVLGAVDASGSLHVYDLLRDTDRPTVSLTPTQRGLASLRFNPPGTAVATGDVAGVVALTRLADELASPRGDEARRLHHSLLLGSH